MSERASITLGQVRALVGERRFNDACAVLRTARDLAREEGAIEDEQMLTSLLISHLSIAGRDDDAVAESLRAEAEHPNVWTLQLQTIRQLLRAGRRAEARNRCETLLKTEVANHPEVRHMLLCSLGESEVDTAPAKSAEKLGEALDTAAKAFLDPDLWDRSLAIKLMRRGNSAGRNYLMTLRSVAERMNDEATVKELDAFLAESR